MRGSQPRDLLSRLARLAEIACGICARNPLDRSRNARLLPPVLLARHGRTRCGQALVAAALSVACVGAWAQGVSPQSVPAAQPEKPASVAPAPADLEPGVNTSATSMSSTEPAAAQQRKSSQPGSPTQAPGSASGSGKSGAPGGARARSRGPQAAPKSGAGAGKAQDRIELDTTQITGNRELPKVLYIVPWKRSDLGDLVGKPVNSLLDEVLTPVDRDVFQRQNRYYEALKPDTTSQAAGSSQPGSGEKH